MGDMLVTADSMSGRVPVGTSPAAVVQAVEEATGLIQLATGQRLVLAPPESVSLRGGRSSVWLPERPVVSVDSVVTVVRGVSSVRVVGVDYLLFGAELQWLSPVSGVWPGSVVVTYTHGFGPNVVPQSLQAVCRAVAARAVVNPGSYRSHAEAQGDWSESYTVAGSADQVGPGLSGRELADLAPFRVPVVV